MLRNTAASATQQVLLASGRTGLADDSVVGDVDMRRRDTAISKKRPHYHCAPPSLLRPAPRRLIGLHGPRKTRRRVARQSRRRRTRRSRLARRAASALVMAIRPSLFTLFNYFAFGWGDAMLGDISETSLRITISRLQQRQEHEADGPPLSCA